MKLTPSIPVGMKISKRTDFLIFAWTALNGDEGVLSLSILVSGASLGSEVLIAAGTSWERFRPPEDEYWEFHISGKRAIRLSAYLHGDCECNILTALDKQT